MKCKFAVVVYDCMTCVCTALKADYNITVICKDIGYLPLPSSPQLAPTIAFTIT